VLRGEVTALLALADLYSESELHMKPGEPVLIVGPLDFAVGVVDCIDGAYIRLLPGCVTIRGLDDQSDLLATGKPGRSEYAVHPRGHNVAVASVTGYSLLPSFDPKDWPTGGPR
jgi:hypothetical protein